MAIVKMIRNLENALKHCDSQVARSYIINTLAELRVQEKWLLPDWRELKKPILCVDFDGVISEYKHGWQGPEIINDDPVPGSIEFLIDAHNHFEVVIFSSRCNHPNGIKAMKEWLESFGLPDEVRLALHFQIGKPSFAIMIDDRCIKFNGDWTLLKAKNLALNFAPWYYQRPEWQRQ